MNPDTLALYLAVGRAQHPWLDAAVAFIWWTAPGLFLVGAVMAACSLCVALARGIHRHRTRHHLPAAPDNLPGTDPELLWDCRRILAASHTHQTRKETP